MNQERKDSQWDRHGVIQSILQHVAIPKMGVIRQHFPDNRIKEIPTAIHQQLSRESIATTVEPGMSIAITVGSRGIANIETIIREVIGNLKAMGAKPFIVPTMGSHGGATASGQRELIEEYGITEERVGAPIRATMDTKVIGQSEFGNPVHLDAYAAEADGIVVIARVKPHTAFRGEYESGLMKMMAIGLGKQHGAEVCHAAGFGKMAERVIEFGSAVLAYANVLFGVAIIENAFDETTKIEAVPKDEILSRERELLQEARDLMPKIFFGDFDVLIVDRIGKNFSGDGADPNITGTYCTPYASGGPTIQRYVVLDISDETRGNAVGVGLADVTTKRLFDKTDFDAGYPNALTSRVLRTVAMPLVLSNDRLAIQAAIYSSVGIGPSGPRIVRIPDTSHLGTISISESLFPEAEELQDVETVEAPKELNFDEKGNLW